MDTDYFYTNSDFIADKLGDWAENMRDITTTITIGGVPMLLYPLYQVVYWFGYVLFSAGMWFLYELVYTFTDTLADMSERRKKIKRISNSTIQID